MKPLVLKVEKWSFTLKNYIILIADDLDLFSERMKTNYLVVGWFRIYFQRLTILTYIIHTSGRILWELKNKEPFND